jgi:ribose transport system substrate-binding protein
MKTLRFAAVCGVVFPLALLVGCGNKGGDGGGDANKAPHDPNKPTVAFISNNSFEFWTIAERGTEKAAKEFGVNVEFKRPPAGGSSEVQRRFIEDLRAKGVKGLAISPNDAAGQSAFLKETNEQVPVVTQDSDVPDLTARRCYIGTDNIKAGMAAGELVKEALPDGGNVVIYVGKLDVQNAVERRKGVVVALAGGEDKCKEELEQLKDGKYPIKFGKYTLVDTKTDNGDQAECRKKVDDTIVKNPEVNCMVGLWAYNPPAMIAGVKEAGKEGKIVIVGFDENDETLQGIKDGSVYGTIVQNPFMFGYEAIKILAGFAKNDPKVLERPDIDADKRIYVKHRVIAKKQPKFSKESKEHPWEEVEAFHADLKKLKGQ